jgi:hypothetical protein
VTALAAGSKGPELDWKGGSMTGVEVKIKRIPQYFLIPRTIAVRRARSSESELEVEVEGRDRRVSASALSFSFAFSSSHRHVSLKVCH